LDLSTSTNSTERYPTRRKLNGKFPHAGTFPVKTVAQVLSSRRSLVQSRTLAQVRTQPSVEFTPFPLRHPSRLCTSFPDVAGLHRNLQFVHLSIRGDVVREPWLVLANFTSDDIRFSLWRGKCGRSNRSSTVSMAQTVDVNAAPHRVLRGPRRVSEGL
jgi:hypothetical protein